MLGWSQCRNHENEALLVNNYIFLGHKTQYFGHTKGDLAFDNTSGFWLIHSVPKFPPFAKDSYDYPETGTRFGQSLICVTFDYSTFNEIGLQLLYNGPPIYDHYLPDDLASDLPNIQKAIQGRCRPMWSNPGSGIQEVEFRIQGVNLVPSILPLKIADSGYEIAKEWDLESEVWNRESREWNRKSREWNPESKDLLDYLTWCVRWQSIQVWICQVFVGETLIVNSRNSKLKFMQIRRNLYAIYRY
jgi:hypothetical protein